MRSLLTPSLLIFIYLAECRASSAALDGPVELLSEVVKAIQSNTSRVKTWAGKVIVKDEAAYPGYPVEKSSGTVDYVLDTASGQLRWTWEVDVSDTMTGLARSNGLIAGDRFTSLTEDVAAPGGEPTRSVQVTEPSSMSVSPSSKTFDPRYYLGYRGEDLVERLTYFIEHADEDEVSNWTVTKDGDLVTLSFDDGSLTNKYVMDLSKGGALVQYRATQAPNNLSNWVGEYTEVDGIWMPATLTYTSHSEVQNADAEKSNENDKSLVAIETRSLEWVDTEVNKPLADDAFELTAIGIRENDLVADAVSGITYRANEKLGSPVAPKGSRWRNRLLVINVAVAVAIVLAIVWKRMHASKT